MKFFLRYLFYFCKKDGFFKQFFNFCVLILNRNKVVKIFLEICCCCIFYVFKIVFVLCNIVFFSLWQVDCGRYNKVIGGGDEDNYVCVELCILMYIWKNIIRYCEFIDYFLERKFFEGQFCLLFFFYGYIFLFRRVFGRYQGVIGFYKRIIVQKNRRSKV